MVYIGGIVIIAVLAGLGIGLAFAAADTRRRARQPEETSHLLSDD
jgi:hypothetical protein